MSIWNYHGWNKHIFITSVHKVISVSVPRALAHVQCKSKQFMGSNKGKWSQGISLGGLEVVGEGTFLKTCKVDCTSGTIINHLWQAQSTWPFLGDRDGEMGCQGWSSEVNSYLICLFLWLTSTYFPCFIINRNQFKEPPDMCKGDLKGWEGEEGRIFNAISSNN